MPAHRHDPHHEQPSLGLQWDGTGCTAGVWAPHASSVDICLFTGTTPRSTATRVALTHRTGGVWHGYLPGIGPGQRYGLRVDGPYDPARGLRHNPAKLLVDPYARRVEGEVRSDPSLLGYADDPHGSRPNAHDSAPFVPRGVVTDDEFTWAGDTPPRTPWSDTVVYEAHVKGLTALHPGVPPALRGRYAGLASPAVIEHLVRLGVTAVELLPVQAFATELAVQARGQRNYWGYNTLGFFAPHPGYAATVDPLAEFKTMVRELHSAGLEVLLDVVYNHTAEGDELGPTLSLRGLDNPGFYRLLGDDPARYADSTGCGNTLALASPPALRLVLDSLRYWVQHMHVDGFRFDLASTLTHGTGFLDAVAADPVLREVKLIAEPWDMRSYDVGGFPAPWAEWNGRYRDDIRDAWHGRARGVGTLAARLSGSADIYSGRGPLASVNFVTAHDGFGLADLVSYERKHNDANGEHGRDGTDDNRSVNASVEGPTVDATVLETRRRLRRAHLATLLLSAGVPMLLAGDELGHTQHGNNNGYCQDNPLSWLAWPCDEADPAGPDPMLLPLVRGLTALRREAAALRRLSFFAGGHTADDHTAGGVPDISWFSAGGTGLTPEGWQHADLLQVLLSGSADGHAQGPSGSYLLVLNLAPHDAAPVLPHPKWVTGYRLLLDTAAPDLAGFGAPDIELSTDVSGRPPQLAPGAAHVIGARSVLVLAVTTLPS